MRKHIRHYTQTCQSQLIRCKCKKTLLYTKETRIFYRDMIATFQYHSDLWDAVKPLEKIHNMTCPKCGRVNKIVFYVKLQTESYHGEDSYSCYYEHLIQK